MAEHESVNARRAERAGKAIAAFCDATGADEQYVLGDLLCDLRHWADKNGQDFDDGDDRGKHHYNAEIEEEREEAEDEKSEE